MAGLFPNLSPTHQPLTLRHHPRGQNDGTLALFALLVSLISSELIPVLSLSLSMAPSFDSIGFIGLGIMGFPMLENLIQKLPNDMRYYVYDVSTPAMDAFCAQHPTKVHACANAREVADKSVVSLVIGQHAVAIS